MHISPFHATLTELLSLEPGTLSSLVNETWLLSNLLLKCPICWLWLSLTHNIFTYDPPALCGSFSSTEMWQHSQKWLVTCTEWAAWLTPHREIQETAEMLVTTSQLNHMGDCLSKITSGWRPRILFRSNITVLDHPHPQFVGFPTIKQKLEKESKEMSLFQYN